MAALVLGLVRQRQNLRRNRIFRDRTHPLDVYDDVDLFKKYRFRRHDILRICDEISDRLEVVNRGHTVLPSLQVCVTLRFYACGSFQSVCGDTVGLSQPTVSRIITRVTNALMLDVRNWITFPDQREAERQKLKFFLTGGCPNVFGAVDGTLIKIQRPNVHEDQYVDRNNNHSLNVQVICNAELVFIDICARWPGRVHDARVLRQSAVFAAFENNPKPVDGLILGDSGYMGRDWLFTPILHPENRQQERYNTAHRATRNTVERAIGVAKRRWNCLRRLRLSPEKACAVIMVCFMLHNRARALNLPDPDGDGDDDDGGDDNNRYDQRNDDVQNLQGERARVTAGKAARNRYVTRFF